MTNPYKDFTEEDFTKRVCTYLVEAGFAEFPKGPIEIVSTTRLLEDLGFDDLDMVEVAMDLEDEFMIIVEDEVMEGFKTVSDIAKAVKTAVDKS